MFRDRYKNAYDTITPPMELVSDTLRKVQSGGGASVRKRFAVRMSIAAAAAAVCLVMAVPVCAAHIPAFLSDRGVRFACDGGPPYPDRKELYQPGDHDAGGSD